MTTQTTRRPGTHWIASARLAASSFVALLLIAVSVPLAVIAHAPAIAVAEFTQPLLVSPIADSAALSELSAGSEMELTGHADGQFVEVVAAGVTGWVDVNAIHAGQIQTATTNAVTHITDAPSDDGRLLNVVPAGASVILTGAAVDQYLAGSYEGTGGWLLAANLE